MATSPESGNIPNARQQMNAQRKCGVNFKLALATGTCHLSLQGLKNVLLQLLVFNTPESSSGLRAERRPSVQGAGGAGGLVGLLYFQEPSL